MIIHRYRVHSELGEPFPRFLASDLHMGSSNCDHQAITADFSNACDKGARILVNGDLFDAIGPMDKRFDLNVLHHSIRGEKDLTGAIVDLAVELLRPFRHNIDVMGIGNHEESWIKYYSTDPVRLLIARLNAEGANIRHGSQAGYIVTQFVVPGFKGRQACHKLCYYHGTGGDSPVTKGMIDFQRQGRNWRHDCLTFGHKHNITATVDAIGDVDSDGFVQHKQLGLQTGSYYQNYGENTEKKPLNYSFAEKFRHAPKPLGGLFLVLTPVERDGRVEIKQDFASDVFFTKKAVRKTA